jgi:predicted AlkP superfamily phosphohydrolase/phosphomutase
VPASLLLIGLDAVEPSVVAADRGGTRFPALAGLGRRGVAAPLVGLSSTLTDTVWPELRTGIRGTRSGIYYQPRQISTGEGRARARRPDELGVERFSWNVAAAAGMRVAAIDQPLAPVAAGGAAHEVAEWGTHDRPGFAGVSWPGTAPRLGRYPIGDCAAVDDGTPAGRRRLLEGLEEGARRKGAMLVGALESASWDLFTAVFSEGHCAGHHLWPLRPGDPGDPERTVPGTAVIERVYASLDAGVAALVEAAGLGATVIVYSSHGMGPADHGLLLVGHVLERMGLNPGNRRRRRVAALMPGWLKARVRRAVDPSLLQRAGLTYDRPLDAPGTTAIPLPNSRHGAIRLALAGRDPGGTLDPGSDEHRRVLEGIRREFLGLETLGGGVAAVEEVVVLDEELGEDRHPDLPDVIVRFRRDIGPIGACRSASLGTVRPVAAGAVTGDHGTPGGLWAAGPGIGAGGEIGTVETVDLAPTVLARLGLRVPDWCDGTPVPALTRPPGTPPSRPGGDRPAGGTPPPGPG